MRGSNETLSAFAGGEPCPSTIGQTGLRDTDGDSRPDVVDARPAFATRLEWTDPSGTVTLRGAVAERPRHCGAMSTGVYFRQDLSIKVPYDLRYRVDDGAWQALPPSDGAFCERAEGWTLTTEQLTPGHHVLDLEGTTGGLPVARLAPLQLVRLSDDKVMATLTTGQNGVWTGTLAPAHTRTHDVVLKKTVGQFQGPAASGLVTITVK